MAAIFGPGGPLLRGDHPRRDRIHLTIKALPIRVCSSLQSQLHYRGVVFRENVLMYHPLLHLSGGLTSITHLYR